MLHAGLRNGGVFLCLGALSAVGCAPDDGPAEQVGVARSPLVLTEQQKLTASDGEYKDYFGWAVAIDGDTAIIGAPQTYEFGNSDFVDPGVAYVFTRTNGVWTETQKLTASTMDNGDGFGNAIALEGDTAIIGASRGAYENGMAYVFTRTAGVWTETQKLEPTHLAVLDGDNNFGGSVALRGDTMLIGQPAYNLATPAWGAVYFYTRTAGVWTEQQWWNGPPPNPDLAYFCRFGSALGLSDDTAVVGVAGDKVTALDQGSAFVYTLNNGVWSQQQQLIASDALDGDSFGGALSLDGDTLLISAQGNDVGANTNQGSTYVFTRSGGVWTEQSQLTASDGAANDRFGEVLLSGDVALIGALTKNIGANSEQGAVYAFARTGGVWSQAQQLTASDGAVGDQFGTLARSGDTVIVGARGKDGQHVKQGAAYIYLLDGAGGGGAGGSTNTGGAGTTGTSTTTGAGGNSGESTNTGGTGTMGGTTDTGGATSTGTPTTTGDGGTGDGGGGCNGNGDGGCNAAGTTRGGGSLAALALALLALARRRNRPR